MSDLANANGAAMLEENNNLRARIAELERANAELSRDAKRWKTCERLVDAFTPTGKMKDIQWTLSVSGGETFADAIDGEGV